MRKSRGYSSSNQGTNELSETLYILSHSGIDIASRKLFLTKMSNQLCCRSLNDATKFNPTLGAPGSSPTREEVETWINALNQYTRYLSSLLPRYDEAEYNEYIVQREIESDYDTSSQVSSEVNADEALQVLINRARNSPKSKVSEKATQTLVSPNEKSTQTPPQTRYYEKSTSTSRRSPSLDRRYSPLSRSQPSRQSRGTEISPPPEISTQTKSLLAQRIENSPRFLSYNDPDEDVVAEIINDNSCYQNTSRTSGSPRNNGDKVYIISPKKKEEETQTFDRYNDDNEIEVEYSRSWKRMNSKTLSPNSSSRRRQQSPKRFSNSNRQ